MHPGLNIRLLSLVALISLVAAAGCGSASNASGLTSDAAAASADTAAEMASTVPAATVPVNPIPRPKGTLELRFNAGAELESGIAEAGGSLYFSASSSLIAVDENTGQERWRLPSTEWIHVTPKVDSGTIYFASNQYPQGEATGYHVHAVDSATGQERWQAAVGDEIMTLEVTSGVIYAAGTEKTYALDAAAGQQRWSRDHGAMLIDAGDPATLYAADSRLTGHNRDTTCLYALDKATGAEKWKTQSGGVPSGMRAAGGLVYLATFGDMPSDSDNLELPPAVFALDAASGRQRWIFAPGGDQPVPRRAISANFHMLAISNPSGLGLIVIDSASDLSSSLVPTVDRTIFELDPATGQQKESYKPPGGAESPQEDPTPVCRDGVYYLVTADLGRALNDPNARITYAVSAIAARGGAEQWTVRAQAGTSRLLSFAGLFNNSIWLAAKDSGEIFVLK